MIKSLQFIVYQTLNSGNKLYELLLSFVYNKILNQFSLFKKERYNLCQCFVFNVNKLLEERLVL